ncbi:hypothetical protein [Paenibacillus hexagrammi]|uniref:Uncharacterized protein n=1 Tax=Paenibacillus hexagrammi TaxID=2908839 RepID=A0ABY3SCF4_9BACL|nr:hypothetical protein [Paenibacillus sp. YPD9-1]UJF31684.1 hypothetical protein L0M14_18070 [Paenibacillus sp. YPD9-1]
MRVLSAYVSILLISLSFLLITDLVAGMKLSTAIDIMKRAYFSSTRMEEFILIFILLYPIINYTVKKAFFRSKNGSSQDFNEGSG